MNFAQIHAVIDCLETQVSELRITLEVLVAMDMIISAVSQQNVIDALSQQVRQLRIYAES
ncbi:hypothetical protein [Burkholderia sp. JKS000303]|uniref:hypothetical protein n=1 Tax=Burkholderia sp. JKS000303 TaxID=1938747 RepID=UPI000BFA31F5|nr:hypothetical protein [Burkholderia sp. JKS000303]PFH12867.1 hypothetical protein BX604_7287 [Burkholderia sp. JKS000303]